jgi:uncharacterized protein
VAAGLMEINARHKGIRMRFRVSLVVCTVVTLLQAAPVMAQAPATPAPSPAPSAAAPAPDALAAAKELVSIMKLADQLKNVMPIIMNGLKPAIVQNRPDVARDYDALMPIMLELTNKRLDDYVEAVAAIYGRNFSADELRQITAFYQTQPGRKMLEKLPTLMQESVVVGQRFGQSLAVELESRMKDELRKKGYKDL